MAAPPIARNPTPELIVKLDIKLNAANLQIFDRRIFRFSEQFDLNT